MESIIKFREELTRLWEFLTEAGYVSEAFPGFDCGGFEEEGDSLSRESFVRVARLFLPSGPSVVVERRTPDEFIVIYGAEAMDRWPKDDPFFDWPFFPLMVDSESYTVGLTLDDADGGFRLLCVSKDCLYDDSMPDDEDLAYVSEKPVWELPKLVRDLVESQDEVVFFGNV
ncbi:hypothetical protein OKA05_17385 [Luteolibacter arcticus]|uniref:SMI1/KNR4 family protein n=1 Tax=Luteolibacter arcticus TaxID=1581411 RepID=A0ABT3GLF8_9BACT|nr:hypothetical protein [Luteolibacter arcticus]MCW1924343.1 hypothetical protein [Luteolibacter arcticus]